MPADTLKTIPVGEDVQLRKRRLAAEANAAWTAQGTFVVNIVSSPGSGKTSLLAEIAKQFAGKRRIAVLVGDIETDRDAQRLAPYVPVVQLTTGGACHLELPLVQSGLSKLPDQRPEFLFIENVGNLVCPASHDLGEHIRVVLISVTEGDDKPGKYPKMFRTSRAMIVTKMDLLPYVPFQVDAVVEDARRLHPGMKMILTSAYKSEGIETVCAWLEAERDEMLARQTRSPSS